MKAGRGYIIRFFEDSSNMALFYAEDKTPYYRHISNPWSTNLKDANVFLDYVEAVKTIIKIKKTIKNLHKKGYLYISKVFYKEDHNRLAPIKLTKPDRHDFLQAI